MLFKNNYNFFFDTIELHEIQATPLTRQNCRLGYLMHINAKVCNLFE